MANTIDDVLAEVQQETTLETSLLTLVSSLQAQVAAAGTDPAKVQAVFDAVKANITNLTSAVAANTPAAPTA